MRKPATRGWAALRGGVCLMLGVAVLAVVPGCEFSRVNPQAVVQVSGHARDATGAPLAGVTVRLFKEADIGEALLGVIFAIGTLGAVCLLPAPPAVCHQARTTTAGADGSFTFVLRGSDTQGLIGTVSTLDVVVADPGHGDHAATTTLSVKARTASIALPDARLWQPPIHLAEGGGHLAVDWSGPPAGYGAVHDVSVQLLDSAGRGVLWSQPATGPRAAIDARVFEDVPVQAAVQAVASLDGQTRAAYLSPRLDARPVAGAPPSRHRPCSAVVATTLAAVPQPTCAITDGDLVAPAHLSAPAAEVVTGAVVDLSGPRAVSLVVARGLAGTFVVETSTDGIHYAQVGSGDSSTAAIAPPAGTSARYVRVRSPGGLDESLMSEISVW